MAQRFSQEEGVNYENFFTHSIIASNNSYAFNELKSYALNELKSNLNGKFQLTDFGLISWFVGISFTHTSDCIELQKSSKHDMWLKGFLRKV